MNVPFALDNEFSYPFHTTGTASTVAAEASEDIGEKLRKVYEEVSGKKAPRPEKPRIGFLP